MRCEEVRDLASAWLDRELTDGLAREIAAHEAGCPDCHALVADLRRALTQVARLGREPSPAGLEDRVRARLAEERGFAADAPSVAVPRRFSAWPARLARQAAAMAAVCLLSVAGTWTALERHDAAAEARHDVLTAHVRSLLQDSPIQVASSDSHTVRPWFNGRVEFAPPVKDLAAEGFQLVGGRLDFVEGHRVAALVYRRRLHTISVFVWPEGAAAAHAVRPAQQAGLNLLSWSKDGLVWWAVSDLNADELRELRALL